MLHACSAQAAAHHDYNNRGGHRPLASTGIARPFAHSQLWRTRKAKLVSQIFSSSVPYAVRNACRRTARPEKLPGKTSLLHAKAPKAWQLVCRHSADTGTFPKTAKIQSM